MSNTISTVSKERFTPKMENFKTSLMYEGLSLKKIRKQSIAELKRKHHLTSPP